jgi:hypothetical protein
MKIPTLSGLIKRRLLINYRVDPEAMRRMLPAPFRPKLQRGYAIAGICLIRLEQIRPLGVPAAFGFSSENAAHRVAVEWTDAKGDGCEGVFIPRRDTASHFSHLAGGRLFPGEHHLAKFDVMDDGSYVDLLMTSSDQAVAISVNGRDSDVWPATSCFGSLEESSRFFECGCVGYSVTRDSDRLDGMRLKTLDWRVRPFEVEQVQSSFFTDTLRFPAGSIEFDHALIMRDIPHEWHSAAAMRVVAA